jgi:hypothetical protein
MFFKISGDITGVELIAQGAGIRCLGRLQRAYGIGNWKKKKGLPLLYLRMEHLLKLKCIGMRHMALVKWK